MNNTIKAMSCASALMLIALIATGTVHAQKGYESRVQVPSGVWMLMSSPSSEDTTPGILFGDQMEGLEYGKKWQVYTIKGTDKIKVTKHSRIRAGTAFWFKQESKRRINYKHVGDSRYQYQHLINTGWAYIGNPAPESTRMDNDKGITLYFWNTWSKKWIKKADTNMHPWVGYLMYNSDRPKALTIYQR